MKSARINFGIPESEYIVQVDDTGAATSCYNQDTDTEYIGGGGGGGGDVPGEIFTVIINSPAIADSTISFNGGNSGEAPYNVFGLLLDENDLLFDFLEVSLSSGLTNYEQKFIKYDNGTFEGGGYFFGDGYTADVTGDIALGHDDEYGDYLLVSGPGTITIRLAQPL